MDHGTPITTTSHEAAVSGALVTAPGLRSTSLLGLLATQFLGATNDNMFRLLAVGVATEYYGSHNSSMVLSLGLACFTLPYLILAAVAGYLADRFAKRDVIIACKVAEIVIMLLAVGAIALRNMPLLFVVLGLMGGQSALFGPAKLGGIPEMLRAEQISAANGFMGLATVLATVVGVALGSYLHDLTRPFGLTHLWLSGGALVLVAIVGTLTSFLIRTGPAAAPHLPFPRQMIRQTWRDLKVLGENRAILRVSLGVAFFWSLGALAQSNILEFGKEGGLLQREISPLLAALVVGVGLGSVLAGFWSGGRVELGILPLGAGGLVISSLLLFSVSGQLTTTTHHWTGAYLWSMLWLFTLGTSAGFFDVPLSAYLQHRSPPEKRGTVLAASNFLTFLGILGSAGLYYLLRVPTAGNEAPLFTARQIFLLSGLATLPVFFYIVCLLPGASLRFLVWLAAHTLYRVRVYDRQHLPERGGALLVCNRVSWIDGLFLLAASSRGLRLVVRFDDLPRPWLRRLAQWMGVIVLEPNRKSFWHALEAARYCLQQGELVGLFPERRMTRTGQLQAFRQRLLSVVEGTHAPVIPVYLDGLWGSILSWQGGNGRTGPRAARCPVSIYFGQPLPPHTSVDQVRRAVEQLEVHAVQQRQANQMILPRRFLRMCRRNFFRSKVADSTGAELTGGKLLAGCLALRRALNRLVLQPDERYVGLLLPPSVGAVVANVALPLDGRVAVNLNYTMSAEVLNACVAQCGIRHVLTSRKVMEKLNLKLDAEVVYLDELREQVNLVDKLTGFAKATLLPVTLLERILGLHRIDPDQELTVIFTSGSTGEPKGVMLSHRNVGSNIEAIDQIIHLRRDDLLVGVLPFFHSYGFTVTLWTVLAFDAKGAFHFNPLDAGQVGKMCHRHRATLLMGTPTFLRSYLRRCQPEELQTLEVIFASAEKLPVDLADAFEQKFGVRPVEGYGATELSPLVSVNIPAKRSPLGNSGLRDGSVGRTIPGVEARVVDPDTFAPLPPDTPGMLLIRGPNVMRGYLHRPDLTARVMHDDWYITGDMARVDADGFIFITGRQSRFSKIGGEMVPHIMIEELLQRLVGAGEDELRAVVTAVPDSRKGERLVVLHLPLTKPPSQLCKELQEAGLPNLWIPSADSFAEVPAIPVLGTGKLDLKAVKDLALAKFAETAAAGR